MAEYLSNIYLVFMMISPITDREWRQEDLAPFKECILTWNGERPEEGRYLFYVSLKTHAWSSWLLYAMWGKGEQKSFHSVAEDAPVRTYQDAVEVMGGGQATGVAVKVIAEGGALLAKLRWLHIHINSIVLRSMPGEKRTICLGVPGISQMQLPHPRHGDLCSPTSTAAVVRYLSGKEIDPVEFAQCVWDGGFDIFGNWVFNAAEAAARLGPEWQCYVQRLTGFSEIYAHLTEGNPVVVSVRGSLKGSAQSYAEGHLIVVVGYNAEDGQVFCMDPAFPSDHETHVEYPLKEFLQAWGRRGRVAYIFSKVKI